MSRLRCGPTFNLARSTLPFGNAIVTTFECSAWIQDDSRNVQRVPVRNSGNVVCSSELPVQKTIWWQFMTILSCSFIFYCPGARVTSDFLTDTASGSLVYCYPKPSIMGPPSRCFRNLYLDMTSIGNIVTTSRCWKYCNGPLCTILLARKPSCRLCQVHANPTYVWPLNLPSDGNKLTVNPLKSEKNPIPWFDTRIRCVAVMPCSVLKRQCNPQHRRIRGKTTGTSKPRPSSETNCPCVLNTTNVTIKRSQQSEPTQICRAWPFFMCASKIIKSCYSRPPAILIP